MTDKFYKKIINRFFGLILIIKELNCEYNYRGQGLTEFPSDSLERNDVKILNLSNNQLISLPDEIRNLQNLEKFYVNNNQLISLPSAIGNLQKLELFSLNNNQITSLPKEIGNLINLLDIRINNNKIVLLPNEIGSLKKLEKFYAVNNLLIFLPKEIGNLINLTKFYIDNNKLTSLPSEIGNLKQLKWFSLYNNQLTSLPKEIGNLTDLQVLIIDNNQLTSLPREIGNLQKLEWFSLDNNQFTSLPREIGNLINLQELKINNNQLTSLPRNIERLSSNFNFKLCLMNNPLIEYGDNNSLGFMDLYDIFGNRVIEGSIIKRLTKDMYEKLSKESLHWNFDLIKNIKLEEVPKGSLSGQEIFSIWNSSLSEYQTFDYNESLIEDYIKTLYQLDDNAFKGVRMYPNFVEITKNLIEAIFKKIVHNISESIDGSEDDARTHITLMNNAMKYCADRQYATLHMIYSSLYSKEHTLDSFVSFIKNQIGFLKNNVFEMVVTPGEGLQNVHTLNYWKYTLKDEIGFNTEYETQLENLDNDIFDNNPVKVVEAFYKKFTPNYVIENLIKTINETDKILTQSGSFLMRKINEDKAYAKLFFEFEDDDKLVDLTPSSIKYEGVKEILLSINILETQSI